VETADVKITLGDTSLSAERALKLLASPLSHINSTSFSAFL